jgi:hypothetical protein
MVVIALSPLATWPAESSPRRPSHMPTPAAATTTTAAITAPAISPVRLDGPGGPPGARPPAEADAPRGAGEPAGEGEPAGAGMFSAPDEAADAVIPEACPAGAPQFVQKAFPSWSV